MDMKKLVFGSLNIDRTYQVPHFVKPGETMAASRMDLFCGGKGFNQAIAFSRAGDRICFAGAVGEDGEVLVEAMKRDHICLDYLLHVPGTSGHAVIQVDQAGQNCIIILGGANHAVTEDYVDKALSHFSAGDFIMLQNEISNVPYILRRAKEKGMLVAFNPSPFNEEIGACDLTLVDYLLINEVEGAALAHTENEEEILTTLHRQYPKMRVVLTLGKRGVVYLDSDGQRVTHGVYDVPVVDTTAAGDTFTGYFLSEMLRSGDVIRAMELASTASGLCVSRKGASASIPYRDEVTRACRS